MYRRTLLAAVLVSTAAIAFAQQAGFKRTVLQRTDIDGGKEVVLVLAEFETGASTGRHTHPGTEAAYVVEGELSLQIDGGPAKTLRAGESIMVPVGKVHIGTASKPTKIVSTLVIEKGKQIATPAP